MREHWEENAETDKMRIDNILTYVCKYVIMNSIKQGGLQYEKVYVYPHSLMRNGIVYALGHHAYDRL